MAGTPSLHISRLQSGGVITNYQCPSRCGHCLYACSPQRAKDYLEPETAGRIFRKIRELGCGAVHLGGGEPLLLPEELQEVLAAAREAGVRVEYVETNSAWHRDQETTVALLRELRAAGLTTLLVSISPFHNAYIPFARVKGVLEACRVARVQVFPWVSEFVPEISRFDEDKTHALTEYQAAFGDDYLRNLPGRYWIHWGGRALTTYFPLLATQSADAILKYNRRGCRELAGTGHFHLDLYGNYIPGLCAGLAIRMDDLGKPLEADRYPVLTRLYGEGIGGLLTYATQTHGFQAGEAYLNKCHLCQEIRRFLVREAAADLPELAPRAFYEHL